MGHQRKLIFSSITFVLAALLGLTVVVALKDQVRLGTCTFTLERPRTTQEYAKGLGERDTIAPDHGMWFVFDPPEQPTFWMKGMRFPIDIIWIADKKVVGLNENIPVDDGVSLYTPAEPVDAALEIAAGRSSQCNMKQGAPIL
jgi:uncharacterized membrane protein (UPF0127 family)